VSGAASAPLDHVYVVPAFGDSPHLEACLASLASQQRASPVVVSASVPGRRLTEVAKHYGARCVVHGPNRGIGHDWNAAVDAAGADWVTIAHQDDVYLPEFGARVAAAVRKAPNALLVSTGYAELRGTQVRRHSLLLEIKRLLLAFGYLGRDEIAHTSAKRRLLRFGCSIACPTVTFSRTRTRLRFDEHMHTNLDWEAWTRVAELDGSFVHLPQILMLHRVHPDSETSAGLLSGARASEDLEMFTRFWPLPIARLIAHLYALSYHN